MPEREFSEESIQRLFLSLDADVVVDALLGTGVRLPVSGFMAAIIQQIRRFPRVVAVDIPSGVNCDAMGGRSTVVLPLAPNSLSRSPHPSRPMCLGARGRHPTLGSGSHWISRRIG